MSLYCLELTANSSNIFLLALEWVFSFIVKAWSSIWGPLKYFSKKYFFVYFWRVDENGDGRRNIKFFCSESGTSNATFWLTNEKTNSIWTQNVVIKLVCGHFKSIWTYSNLCMPTGRSVVLFFASSHFLADLIVLVQVAFGRESTLIAGKRRKETSISVIMRFII